MARWDLNSHDLPPALVLSDGIFQDVNTFNVTLQIQKKETPICVQSVIQNASVFYSCEGGGEPVLRDEGVICVQPVLKNEGAF